jgi:microcystin-dependent protein
MNTPFIGEVVLYPYSLVPSGWAPCLGQLLQASQDNALAQLLGPEFGGDGITTFGLPNYQSVTPQFMQYCIALAGVMPGGRRPASVGEISLLPYQGPAGWIECDGQLQSSILFPLLSQLLGNTFGGDGEVTFGVPDLTSTPPPMSLDQPIYWISALGFPAPVEPFLGEIRLFPYFLHEGWAPCEKQLLPVQGNAGLARLLGTTFGGDGVEFFGLPDLSNAPVPRGLQYFIALRGIFPQSN